MSKLTATIPFIKIDKMEIYVNKSKKSMTKIQKELGCDYLINAGLFQMDTFKPINRLVSDGNVLSNGKGMLGFSFSGNKVAVSYENNVNYPDHVSGYPCLLRNGQKAYTSTPAGLSGRRGRSAIGYGTHAIVLYCCSDGSDGMTLDELSSTMRRLGCVEAINLDGGGSSQCDFNGQQIKSSRIVHNYIAIWLVKDGQEKIVSVNSTLNIRKNPPNILGINTSKVIGKYYNNESVRVYEVRNGWGKTDLGWVSMKYLR